MLPRLKGTLRVTITTATAGQLVIEPYVNGTGDKGRYLRQVIQTLPVGTADVTFSGVQSLDQMQPCSTPTGDSSHRCSVVRRVDPVPQL